MSEGAVLSRLKELLGDDVSDGLLLEAVTHSSWVQEHAAAGRQSNERLEFLGDAVVGLAIAAHLFGAHPGQAEGRLSRAKAAAVGEAALASAARRLGLGELLFLGRGEEESGGREKPAILADCFEAVCGAIFLGAGWERASRFVARELGAVADRAVRRGTGDHKSALQELVQARGGTVSYCVLKEEGPDHAKVFTVAVLVDDIPAGQGRGSSKKLAEQEAARQALAAERARAGGRNVCS